MAPNVLQTKAQNYFKDLNPLATKIHSDIDVIADAYAHLWTEFSAEEQHDVINVTLIKPDIVLKYFNDITKYSEAKKEPQITTKSDIQSDDNVSFASSTNSTNFNHIYLYNGKDLCTYQQIITALKYNQDDVCGVYRDEHSEPFNSKTKSQMNLNFTPSSTKNDGLSKVTKHFTSTLGDIDIKKSIDQLLFDGNSKCSTLKSENMQDCRKSFMSKLFSGRNNTLGISTTSQQPPQQQQLQQMRTELAPNDNIVGANAARNQTDVNDVNIGLAKGFDSVSTKSAQSYEKNEPSDESRLIGGDRDVDDDEDDDYRPKPDSHDLSGSYDFLNNW